jgi:cytoskeletal protein RodZ
MTKHKSLTGILVLMLIVVAGGLAGWHIHEVHIAQHSSGTISNSQVTTKGTDTSAAKTQSAAATQSSSSSSVPPSPNDTKTPASSTSPSSSPSDLEMPFGTFVSNHTPGQNGTPTSEESTCNTTPGATCDIQFTDNGVIKDLGPETADSNGSVYWTWNVSGSDLGAGNWQVSAVAKLDGTTKTAVDTMPLEIQ